MRTFLSRARRCSTIAGASCTAMLLLGLVCFSQRPLARARGVDSLEGSQQPLAVKFHRGQLLADVERRLTRCRDRIAAIGPSALAGRNQVESASDRLTEVSISVHQAKSAFSNAQLDREVAEIGVVEYREGIAKTDEAAIAAELTMAKSRLLRARNFIDESKDRLAKVKEASTGKADELALEYMYADNVTDAPRGEPKARLALEEVESKLRFFNEYTKPTRIKRLQSEVEKLRAKEFAKKAAWEMEQAKERQLEAMVGKSKRRGSRGKEPAALTRVFGLEAKVRAELGQISKSGAIDQGNARSITDLLNELEGAVEQSEAEVATARVGRLKMAINDALETGVKTEEAAPVEFSGLPAGIQHRLKDCHMRMARLGESLLEFIGESPSNTPLPASQLSEVEAAKAALKGAILERECAEAELEGYREITFPQKLAINEQRLVQAKNDLAAATQKRALWAERLATNKRVAGIKSVASVHREYYFEGSWVGAEHEMKAAGFAIEQAKTLLKALKEYEKVIYTKRFEATIERARADELKAKAELARAEAEVKRPGTTKRQLSESQKRALEFLNQAFEVDGTIRGKLAQIRTGGKISADLEKEISDATEQLESAVDRAEADSALVRFDSLKKAFGRGPSR
jgi:hypothetical protein